MSPVTRTERKKELQRLIVSRADIKLALDGCELLLRHAEEKGEDLDFGGSKLYMPLLNAVAITYSRPFKHSEPVGPLRPEWHKFDDPRLQELHDILIKIRDTSVAHSDQEVRKVTIYPPGFRFSTWHEPFTSVSAAIIDARRSNGRSAPSGSRRLLGVQAVGMFYYFCCGQ